MAVATDNFNRANNADLGAAWDVYATIGNLQIVGTRIRAGALGGSDNFESFSTLIPGANNQYAQLAIPTWTGAVERYIGVLARAANPDTLTTYIAFAVANHGSGHKTQIVRYVAGTPAVIASENAAAWAAGDVIRIEAQGTTVRVKRNGAEVLSVTDNSIASGRCGASIFIDGAGAMTNAEGDDFECGDLGGTVKNKPKVFYLPPGVH